MMSLMDQQWCPTSVQVTVLQARSLRIKGKSGTNDAYAVMQLGKEKYQTSVVEKSVAPVWKEEAAFDLPPSQGGGGGGERGTLHVHVMHRALVGPDKLLGQAVINLLQLSEDTSRNKTEWFKLLDKSGKADKDRGEVLLDIQFMRNNMTASMFDLSAAGKSRSRLGKFKDKVRGKKKESDTVSGVVPSFTQILTDSEEEANRDGEVAAGKDEKKKKHKMKSLFSPKSNLQRNMSQSLSVLPVNSSLSSSQSSGLNVEASEGKKKFKFMMHKRSGSSESKDSSSGLQKHSTVEQSNLCINGSHVYCEEPQTRTSRIGSNFSLASSGHGSMEDFPERQYTSWTEEDEEMAEVENIKENVDEEEEEERMRMEEERVRKQEEKFEKLAEEKRRQEEEEKIKREEEEKNRREEERKRHEEEERVRREEESKILAEEKRKLEEQERRRIEHDKKQKEEEERIKLEEKKAQEERRRQEEEEEIVRREKERKLAEEKRRLEQEERRAAEEKVKKEEEERRRREEEKAEEERKRQEEENRVRRHEEECENKRRLEEQEKRQREKEERIRKEEERRQKEEEKAKKEREEYKRLEEEKQKLEEERKRKERDEKIRKEEEERIRKEEERRQKEEAKAKKQREEYERLEEEKQKLEEERKRKERDEKIRREEEEKVSVEEERRRKEEEANRVRKEKEQEEKRRLEEQERRRAEEENKRQREEQEKVRKEEAKRQEEEERAKKEKEEYARLLEVKKRREEEERRQKEEEERIRKEEQELIRMEEKRRQQEEEERMRKESEEMKRLAEQKRKAEEQEKKRIDKEEKIRGSKEEKAERGKSEDEAGNLKKGQLRRDAGEEKKKSKVAVESPSEVTSTNPFDDSYNPFEDNPNSSAGNDSSTAKASSVQQRCQSAVEIKTISKDERDLISAQREKRPAPQPPGRNQAERPCQRDADVSTQHLAQTNNQSNDKNIKTAFVPPQRLMQMIAPVSRSLTDTNSTQSLMHGSATKGTNAATQSKRPAPPRPCSVDEKSSSEPKTTLSSVASISAGDSEAKQVQIIYGLNPFEDDEDEIKAQDDITSSGNTCSMRWPPVESQTASQTKIKSSKVTHAPLPPANVTTPNNNATQTRDPESGAKTFVQETQPIVQSMLEEAGVKKEVPSTTSRRLQPVKPLNPLEQQSVSVTQGEKDKKSTAILSELQDTTKVNGAGLKGPYSQLTQAELISLVLKQEKQLSERDTKISELEQYIDNILVRVIEEKPSILMSMSSMKKAV